MSGISPQSQQMSSCGQLDPRMFVREGAGTWVWPELVSSWRWEAGLLVAAAFPGRAAEYRCDLGIAANAATIGLTLPVGHGQVFAAREPVGVPGPAGLSYCRGGPDDPGQLVTVSPIEPTARAASSLR
jgi:hypothetical protein